MFPPRFFWCSSRLLRCLQQNRAQSRLLYLFIKNKMAFCSFTKIPSLTRQFPTLQEYRESKTRLEEMVDELKKELSTAEHNLQKYNMETKVPKPVKALWHPPTKTSNQLACRPANNFRVFDKILSRWQKLWSRWRRKQTRGKAATCEREFLEKFECIECISSILEQKLECLNRTQTSLIFGFIIQWQHMHILFKLG